MLAQIRRRRDGSANLRGNDAEPDSSSDSRDDTSERSYSACRRSYADSTHTDSNGSGSSLGASRSDSRRETLRRSDDPRRGSRLAPVHDQVDHQRGAFSAALGQRLDQLHAVADDASAKQSNLNILCQAAIRNHG